MFKKSIQLDIFLDVLYKSNYRRFTTLLLPLSDVSDDNNSAKECYFVMNRIFQI